MRREAIEEVGVFDHRDPGIRRLRPLAADRRGRLRRDQAARLPRCPSRPARVAVQGPADDGPRPLRRAASLGQGARPLPTAARDRDRGSGSATRSSRSAASPGERDPRGARVPAQTPAGAGQDAPHHPAEMAAPPAARGHRRHSATWRRYEPRDGRDPLRVVYLVSRFPNVSETFVLRELNEVAAHRRRRGRARLALPPGQPVRPPRGPGLGRAAAPSWPGAQSAAAMLWWSLRRPLRLLSSALAVARGYASRPKLLLRALATLPVASRPRPADRPQPPGPRPRPFRQLPGARRLAQPAASPG